MVFGQRTHSGPYEQIMPAAATHLPHASFAQEVFSIA